MKRLFVRQTAADHTSAVSPNSAGSPNSLGVRQRVLLVLGLLAWCGAIGFGMNTLARYSNTPGTPASPPASWPQQAPVELAQGKLSVLVFVHPQCPCSRATLGELERLLACCRARIQTSVFFYRPRDAAESWSQSDLWHTAAAMPGVRVVDDPGASTARLFGARVSGQVLVYDAQGRLAFQGGITARRGHSGDNDGRDAITAIARNLIPSRRVTPAFGCALYGDE